MHTIDLDPRTRSLLEAALLAPSSHNTQPWRFAVLPDGIALYADRTRALPVNDPHDRELLISCGCALLNLRLAAAREGLKAAVSIRPDKDDEDHLATVTFAPPSDTVDRDAALHAALKERRTYRKRFAQQDVPEAALAELQSTADEEGAWLQILPEESTRQDVATLVAKGDAAQWGDVSWRRELAQWMHPRREGDGLAVPGLVAPLARTVVRTFDMGAGVGARDRELADESPVLAVLGTGRDDPAAWLAAGQALERVLLTACRHGLQASYLNQPIQVASLRPKLQRLTGRAGHPQILLRLGFPIEEVPAAPRRALDEMLD